MSYSSNLIVTSSKVDCDYCKLQWKQGNPRFKICSRCKQVNYCSEECQLKHWKSSDDSHKYVCNYINGDTSFEEVKNNIQNKCVSAEELQIFNTTSDLGKPDGTEITTLYSSCDHWDWHCHFTDIINYCNRLGCFRPASQIILDNKYVKCKKNPNLVRQTGIRRFCSSSCKKKFFIRKPAGQFWKTIRMEHDPFITHSHAVQFIPEACSRERQEKYSIYQIKGSLNNYKTRLLAVNLFNEMLSNAPGKKLSIEYVLEFTKLDVKKAELDIENCRVADVIIRLIQIIERMSVAKFPLIGFLHDQY